MRHMATQKMDVANAEPLSHTYRSSWILKSNEYVNDTSGEVLCAWSLPAVFSNVHAGQLHA